MADLLKIQQQWPNAPPAWPKNWGYRLAHLVQTARCHRLHHHNRRCPVLPLRGARRHQGCRAAGQAKERHLGRVRDLGRIRPVSLRTTMERRSAGLGRVQGLLRTVLVSKGRTRDRTCRTVVLGRGLASSGRRRSRNLANPLLVDLVLAPPQPMRLRPAAASTRRWGHRARVRRRRRQRRPVHLRRRLPPVQSQAAHQEPQAARGRASKARAKARAKAPASQPASRVRAKVRRLPRAPSANCRRSRWPRRLMPFHLQRPIRPPRQAQRQARRRPQVGRRQAAAAEVRRPWHRPRQVPQQLPPALRRAPRRPLLWARRRRRRLPRRSLNPAQVPVLRAVRASRRCRPTSSRTPLRRRPSR